MKRFPDFDRKFCSFINERKAIYRLIGRFSIFFQTSNHKTSDLYYILYVFNFEYLENVSVFLLTTIQT